MCSSPRLIAAYHALHRLSMPRHPPCALLRLISNSHHVVRILRSDRTTGVDSSHPSEPCGPDRPSMRRLSKSKRTPQGPPTESECALAGCRVRATSETLSTHPKTGLLEISRKEVIHPQHHLRLPCYDFALVTELTFDGCPVAVSPPASGPPSFHGVTGGVYKARERIHRGMADPRLLAIPASCSRVADYNPNLDRLLAIGAPSRVGDALYRPL